MTDLEPSLVFVLPEDDGAIAALTSVLGMTAYDARSAVVTPGIARPVRAFDSHEPARAAAGNLNRAGLYAAALKRSQLAAMVENRKRIVSWNTSRGLALEAGDGTIVEVGSTPLDQVWRFQVTKQPAARASSSPGGPSRLTKAAVQVGARAALGFVAGGAVARGVINSMGGGPPSPPRAELSYFLIAYFGGHTEPFFIYPDEVRSAEAGLQSGFMTLEKMLGESIPRDRWPQLRGMPNAQLIPDEGPESYFVVTHAFLARRQRG